MKVKYIGVRPREVAPQGHRPFGVSPGDVVDVTDEVGHSLLRQARLWEEVKESPRRAATRNDDSEDGDS